MLTSKFGADIEPPYFKDKKVGLIRGGRFFRDWSCVMFGQVIIGPFRAWMLVREPEDCFENRKQHRPAMACMCRIGRRAPTDSDARARLPCTYGWFDTRGCLSRRARSPQPRADRRSPRRRAVDARDRLRDPSGALRVLFVEQGAKTRRRARCPSRAGTRRHPASAAG